MAIEIIRKLYQWLLGDILNVNSPKSEVAALETRSMDIMTSDHSEGNVTGLACRGMILGWSRFSAAIRQ